MMVNERVKEAAPTIVREKCENQIPCILHVGGASTVDLFSWVRSVPRRQVGRWAVSDHAAGGRLECVPCGAQEVRLLAGL